MHNHRQVIAGTVFALGLLERDVLSVLRHVKTFTVFIESHDSFPSLISLQPLLAHSYMKSGTASNVVLAPVLVF